MSSPSSSSSSSSLLYTDASNLLSSEQQLLDYIHSVESNSSSFDQTTLQQNIMDVASDKKTLYSDLASSLTSRMGSLAADTTGLDGQLSTMKLLNTELAESQQQLRSVYKDNLNQKRLIQINQYYADVYEDQSTLLKMVVIICFHVCVLCILYKFGLPKMIFYGCMGGTFAVGSFLFIRKCVDMSMRSNMNYQQYDFPFDNTQQNIIPANSTPTNPWYAEGSVSCPTPSSS